MSKPFMAALLLCTFSTFAIAQPSPEPETPSSGVGPVFTPNVRPVMSVLRVDGEIRIDGELTDAGWRRTLPATSFSETFPGDQTRPSVELEAYLTCDDENLYVAFRVKDDPARIRATLSDRDRIWNDDYAGLLLDPNGDGQQVYFIAANPLGVQGDTRSSNGREDVSFDPVFRGVSSGNNLEILPSFTGSQVGGLTDGSVPESGFLNERVQVDPSLNVKYGITSDLTADLTINPDFSQIEADVAQVDVNSTFALFFPERRPYFQEGSARFLRQTSRQFFFKFQYLFRV